MLQEVFVTTSVEGAAPISDGGNMKMICKGRMCMRMRLSQSAHVRQET
jgi:hypothetical protein